MFHPPAEPHQMFHTPAGRRRRPGRARRVSFTMPLVLAAATVSAGLLTLTAAAQPTPSPVVTRWELDFREGPLRLFVDPVSGDAYWYFTYQITNRTGSDQIWAPMLVLYTDEGEILESGRDVSTRVQNSIRDLLGNELLELQSSIIGEVLQGREHARDGLAVWKVGSEKVNEASLFISGISGETARVKHPLTGESVILRKTMQLDYLMRGDLMAYGSTPFELQGRPTWVMR